MLNKIVVVGISTEVGKTLVSAILCKALKAKYWKPIQSGYLDGNGDRDSIWVQNFSGADFFPEAYLLNQPLSPHIAARLDNVEIETSQIVVPGCEDNLIIETAGGLMVPLNDKELMLDVLEKWKHPVVLVVRQYLGNINHTLLSIEALKNKNIPILGMISNGEALPDTLRWLEQYTQIPFLLELPHVEKISPDIINTWADELKNNLSKNGLES